MDPKDNHYNDIKLKILLEQIDNLKKKLEEKTEELSYKNMIINELKKELTNKNNESMNYLYE